MRLVAIDGLPLAGRARIEPRRKVNETIALNHATGEVRDDMRAKRTNMRLLAIEDAVSAKSDLTAWLHSALRCLRTDHLGIGGT